MAKNAFAPCPVCGERNDAWTMIDGGPCMACVKARHKAAITRRCPCGRKRQPKTVEAAGRQMLVCARCLGPIITRR
jgi:hypothetical protein